MKKRTEGAYEKAYKDLIFYLKQNTLKHHLEGEHRGMLAQEIQIIEGNLKRGK